MSDFDSFSYEWQDPYGPFATLHKINPYRIEYLESIAKLKKNQKVLDCGCGGGIFTFALHKAHPELKITGVDSAKTAITDAKAYAKGMGIDINFIHQSALKPYPEKYDVIVCFELIEHLEQPEKLIEMMAHHLKPTGKLIVSTIDKTLTSFLQSIIAAEYLVNAVPRGTHSYQQFIRPDELISLCEKHDLQAIDIKGLHIDPITYKMSITENTQSNYFASFELT